MKLRSTLVATSLAIAALAVAAPAFADCSYPKAPDKFPDGAKASKEEMIAEMKVMRAYNDLVKQYTVCLQGEHDTAVAKIDPGLAQDKKDAQKSELDKVLMDKNDSAVDEATAATGRFNDQIKAYNAAHKS